VGVNGRSRQGCLLLSLVIGVVLMTAVSASAASAGAGDDQSPTVAPVGMSSTAQLVRAGVEHPQALLGALPGYTVPVGQLPTGVAATNTRAYVTDSQSNQLTVVDLTTQPASVITSISVGTYPQAVALSADGKTAYVTNYRSNTLSIVDVSTPTPTVTKTVAVGSEPVGVVQYAGSVYVANFASGTISVVDPAGGTVTGTIDLTGTGTPAPSGLAVAPEGHLYVDDSHNSVTDVIDLDTDAQTGSVPVGTYPAYLALDGHIGYVANGTKGAVDPGTVSVVDLSDAHNPTPVHTIGVGAHPYGIAVLPSLGEAFASNSGNGLPGSGSLSVIDTTTNTVTGTVTVGSTPDAVAVTPDQTTALVTNEADNTLTVLHVNQAPVNTVPGARSVDENPTASTAHSLVFSSGEGDAITTSDSDAGSSDVQATLTVAHGTLTLGDTTGLSSVSGNGSNSVQFTGPISAINSDLNGLNDKPDVGYTGSDPLSFSVDDQGNRGDIGKPQTTTSTVAITVNGATITAGSPSFSGNTSFGVGTSPSKPSTQSASSDTALTSATDSHGDPLTVVPGTITTTNSGTVSMNADGTFTYLSAAGYTGDDTFTFHVTDGSSTTTGTATVAVTHVVWYVKNDDTGANDGRSTSPFYTLAQAQTASSSDDFIFVFHGDGTTTGQDSGITLKDNQTLVGEADDLVVGGQTLNTGTAANRPHIGNSSGTGVALAASNTVEGLNVAAVDSGNGIAGGATATSGGTVADDVISGSAGAGGISLTGTGGTWNISDISSTVTLSSQAAFSASGGATINVTGSDNTLSSQTGIALNVSGTTIGSSGLTFQSISAGTTRGGPTSGIHLVPSIGVNGGLTVTGVTGMAGSGGTIRNTSDTGTFGGDVELLDSGPVSLSNMVIESPTANDIAATEVPNLTVTSNTITGTAAAPTGSGIYEDIDGADGGFFNQPASFNIADNAMSGFHTNVMSLQFAGPDTVTGHITGNTVGNGTAADQATAGSLGDGIDIVSEGNGGTVTADVSSNTVNGIQQGNGIYAAAVDDQYGAAQAPTLNLTLADNAVDLESHRAIDGINVGSGSAGGAAAVCLDATGNSSISKGTAAQNNQFDASGMFVNNADDTSTFALVATGSPYANAGAFGEAGDVEGTLDTDNPGLSASGIPGTFSLPSLAAQFGTAPFTKTASCPAAPAPAAQSHAAAPIPAGAGAGTVGAHVAKPRVVPRAKTHPTTTRHRAIKKHRAVKKHRAIRKHHATKKHRATKKRHAGRAEIRQRLAAWRREAARLRRLNARYAHHHISTRK
jgi:YVTN family beta-propeller protein